MLASRCLSVACVGVCAAQMSVDVGTRSARLALIDKCREDSVIPEPIGVVRKDDIVLDLGYSHVFPVTTLATLF